MRKMKCHLFIRLCPAALFLVLSLGILMSALPGNGNIVYAAAASERVSRFTTMLGGYSLIYGGGMNNSYFAENEMPKDTFVYWWTRYVNNVDMSESATTYSYDEFMALVDSAFVTHSDMKAWLAENSGKPGSYFTYDAVSDTVTLEINYGGAGDSIHLEVYDASISTDDDDSETGTGTIRALWKDSANNEQPLEEAVITLKDWAIVSYEKGGEVYRRSAGEDYLYTVSDGKATITKYVGTKIDVSIPERINGLPVAAIGYMAFANQQLTGVTIPDSVTSIGEVAFMWVKGLKTLTIPDSVTSLGSQAFYHSEIEEITVPGSVETIDYGTFLVCSNLKKVNLGEGIKRIKNEAFNSCYALTDLKLPESLTYIGDLAFNKCTSLKEVTIPGNVQEMGSMAFISCSGLQKVTIAPGVETIGNTAFSACSSLTTVEIPGSVTAIWSMAFGNCENLSVIYYCGTADDWEKVTKGALAVPEDVTMKYHSPKVTTTKATLSVDGRAATVCAICGKTISETIISKPATFSLSANSFTYNGKTQKPSVTVKDAAGKVIAASNYSVSCPNSVNAGAYNVTVTMKGSSYSGSKDLSYKINKAANPMTLKGKTAKLSYKKVKKKKQTIALKKAITVKKAQGKVTFKKKKGDKKITVASSGKITVKKGTKKKTYTITVQVKAAGNTNYKPLTKNVKVKIKIS